MQVESTFKEILDSMDLSDRERTLNKQLQDAVDDKRRWQEEWRSNELSVNDIGIEGGIVTYASSHYNESDDEGGTEESEENFLGINVNARNFEMSKSLLIATPPVAIATPVDSDPDNKLAALACEALTNYAKKEYVMDDHVSNWIHNVYQYGVGWLKQIYSADRGFYLSYDAQNGEAPAIDGDFKLSTPRPWDIFFEPSATCWEDVRYIKERMFIRVSDAIRFFKDLDEDFIRSLEITQPDIVGLTGNESYFFQFKSGMIEVFEHWEKGTPDNKFMGRLIYHLRNGKILSEYKNEDGLPASPCSFEVKGRPGVVNARLPYTFLGHSSVSGSVWCRTPVAFASRKQWILNAAYGNLLRVAETMGTPRLVINKAAMGDDPDNPVSNDQVDMIQVDLSEMGGQGSPYVMQAAQASGDIRYMIQDLIVQINDDWAVNDAMFGKQVRETSALNLQVSINQAGQVKADFFRKYVNGVTDIYKLNQSYIKKYWTEARKVEVVGENGKMFVRKLKGADISQGFDLSFELGTGFALDPLTRQEQINKNTEIYTAAGVDPRKILRMHRNADHRGLYETFDLAAVRGEKILELLKKGQQVKVRGPEDHIGIALYLREYSMGSEYFELDEEIKDLIDQHVEQREQKIAQSAVEAPGEELPQ